MRNKRLKVAEGMSRELGKPITVSMLNDFVRETKKGARFPALYVDAFCRVTGDDTLKRFILGPALSQLLELGERAAVILSDRAHRRVLRVRTRGSAASPEAGVSCAR